MCMQSSMAQMLLRSSYERRNGFGGRRARSCRSECRRSVTLLLVNRPVPGFGAPARCSPPSVPLCRIPTIFSVFVALLFLYEGPLTYSCQRDCSFFYFLHAPYIDILATSYFSPDYKTRPGRVLFSRFPYWGVRGEGGGFEGCSQLGNYSLPTRAERTSRYFCLL